jgi:hypothetical protein
VFEAGLGQRTGEPPGTRAGQPAFPTTTKTGTISLSSDESVSLGGHLLTTTPQTFRDGTTGSLTASYSFNAVTGKGTITYTYTLLDNTLGVPSASFAVVVIDHDGDSNPTRAGLARGIRQCGSSVEMRLARGPRGQSHELAAS